MGLRRMRERAKAFGGKRKYGVKPEQGNGNRVECRANCLTQSERVADSGYGERKIGGSRWAAVLRRAISPTVIRVDGGRSRSDTRRVARSRQQKDMSVVGEVEWTRGR